MTIHLSPGANVNQDTLENSLWEDSDGRRLLTVDLSRARFIDTYALVTILTMISVSALAKWRVELQVPSSAGASTYMARMRFFEHLPANVVIDVEPPVVNAWRSALVELSPLDISAGEVAIDHLCGFTHPQLPQHLAELFTSALAEIGSNVVQHSQAAVGFVAGQRFEKAYQGRNPPRLHLVVGDAGIGIRNSLVAANPQWGRLSDAEAVALALQPGVTSKPAVHSGLGLTTVQDYVQMFEGVLRIRSGSALLTERRGLRQVRTVPEMTGTIVSIELASPGSNT